MRAIWKGAITFGLVNVPVSLFSATESHDVKLHQVHDADGGRIRYQRKCEVCSEVVPYEHIDKAFADGERTVVLTDSDIESLPAERSREIDVLEFVPSDQVDPIMFEGAYYLAPNSSSIKSYVLLRRTLEETDRTAIVSFALRQKTRLGALRVRGEVLMLQTMLWADEVRAAEFPALDEKVRISAKELEMSSALVSSFEADFEPEAYADDYQVQLRQLIDAKLEQGDSIDTEATFGEAEGESGGEVLDLMEALRRSVEASRERRDAGGAGGAGGATAKPAAKPAASVAATSNAPAAKGASAKSATAKAAKAKKVDSASAAETKPAKKRAKKTA